MGAKPDEEGTAYIGLASFLRKAGYVQRPLEFKWPEESEAGAPDRRPEIWENGSSGGDSVISIECVGGRDGWMGYKLRGGSDFTFYCDSSKPSHIVHSWVAPATLRVVNIGGEHDKFVTVAVSQSDRPNAFPLSMEPRIG